MRRGRLRGYPFLAGASRSSRHQPDTSGARAPGHPEVIPMQRYLVERTFPDGLNIPMTEEGAKACLGVVHKNLEHDVTWVFSFVTRDKTHTYCIYDAPSPEAIREAAACNGLPVDRITEVRVLEPYFYV
jgi:hypothetical protein